MGWRWSSVSTKGSDSWWTNKEQSKKKDMGQKKKVQNLHKKNSKLNAKKTLICACCETTSQSERAFIMHALGRKHFQNSGGKAFCGLLPDKNGIIPQLSKASMHELTQAEARAADAQRIGNGDNVHTIQMSNDSVELLQELFTANSGDCVLLEDSTDSATDEKVEESNVMAWNGDQLSKKQKRVAEVPYINDGAAHLKGVRQALPVFAKRAAILELIHQNQIVIVEGETGCGKTTQVSQYILERAAETASRCSIICTQPRRISAISVADRVADERGETVGNSVGYAVHLENKASRHTHLLFCTTGMLLRRLEHDPDLEGTTHVVVDEVHERGVESDFLLLALRDLCKRRVALKVVLMSATMDKDLFGRYFGPSTPSITVPGRTFPVEDFFVEDVLHSTQHTVDPTATWAIAGGKGKGKGGKGFESAGKEDEDARKREDLSDWAVRSNYAAFGHTVQRALRTMDQDQVNYDLLVAVIQKGTLENLRRNDGAGSYASVKDGVRGSAEPPRPTGVLVFLSGAKEIETAQKAMFTLEEFRDEAAREWVLPLHGGLPPDQQKRVFLRPPAGMRKIILSTNVAETSVTIDDIGYVVDTCRMKEMRYDAVRRMSSLEDTVVSRTNARQRRGRAGRVAPGVAVHLGLTRYRHDMLIDDHQPPEVQRVPLEQLVLRIHATGLHLQDPTGKASPICQRLLEPPKPAFVEKAVEQLVRLGAISVNANSERENLTSLGKHLANLPLEARLGKLVLYGTAFGPAATDAALTVAAALTSRNPFLSPLEMREEAGKKKRSFADRLVGGPLGPSDHLAVLAAYREWDQLPHQGVDRLDFCRENFISIKTFQGMSELKRSLLQTLSEHGFVPWGLRARDIARRGRPLNSDGVLASLTTDDGPVVENCPPVLIAALLCAALFPQVATGTMPEVKVPKRAKFEYGETDATIPQRKPKFVVRDNDTFEPVKVKIHPGSVSHQEATLSSPYMLYQELVSTTGLFLRDVTPVPPLALALFGGVLSSAGTDSSKSGDVVLLVDNWIKLSVPAALKAPLLEARRRLDGLLAGWVGMSDDITQSGYTDGQSNELLNTVVKLLSMQEQCATETPQGKKGTRKRLGAFATDTVSNGGLSQAGNSAGKRMPERTGRGLGADASFGRASAKWPRRH
eukprot:TRINITY_DN20004_c0_g1_i2.p1 TRINITY_DN20004_c0_g1~~TRINITY_DN20004_c0_g1_i2.p1  ORF type:complete len:1147 (+),score=159.47 TRINITY_DN20004_c0_g1_i2:56-3496(+)